MSEIFVDIKKMWICSRFLVKSSRKTNFCLAPKFAASSAADARISALKISDLIRDVQVRGSNYGFHTQYFKSLPSEKIVVEFSSPNIAKMFHAGHYRSTVIGNAISNILKAAGHDVCKINYLGDWGVQFALLTVGFQKYGDQNLLNQEPLEHLFNLYVRISKEVKENPALYEEVQTVFLGMENGNADHIHFWMTCKDLSVSAYKKLYDQIGITFDVYDGESNYLAGAIEVLRRLKQKAVVFEEDDALKADLFNSQWLSQSEDYHKFPVLARNNGTTLYLTRDIAAAIHRYEQYHFDRMIYVTDQSQVNHFRQLFAVLEQLGYSWAEKDARALIHKSFGRVEKMKTREGSVVFLSQMLNEAYRRAYEDRQDCETRKVDLENDDVTKTLALSGLIYHDLRARIDKGYKFNWDLALASKGSSGLYLQYTYSRLCSLEKYTGVNVVYDIDSQCIMSQPMLLDLLKHLDRYTSVTETLYETLEPSVLVKYLYDLSRYASKAFRKCIVKDQPPRDAEARLACFNCAKTILGNGFKILGITPLEQH